MRIQHNIPALNAYRNYSNNVSALNSNLEKLSTGYKINRAGDDAAGLAISEKMRAQISGLEQAQNNAKSGTNLVQTAEGAMTEVHDMLNRMYTLAEQSANGTYDDEVDRVQLQKEVESLRTEINRIADSTNYNGIQLLDGSLSPAGVASQSKEIDVPGEGTELGVDTILHTSPALNSDKTQFGIDFADFTFTAATGDVLDIDLSNGETSMKIQFKATAAGTYTGKDIAAAIASATAGSTKVQITGTTNGEDIALSSTAGTINFGGQDFTVSTSGNQLIFSADVNGVNPDMGVSLSIGTWEDDTAASSAGTITLSADVDVTAGSPALTLASSASNSQSGNTTKKDTWAISASTGALASLAISGATTKYSVSCGGASATISVGSTDTASDIGNAIATALNNKLTATTTSSSTTAYGVTYSGGTFAFQATTAAAISTSSLSTSTKLEVTPVNGYTIDLSSTTLTVSGTSATLYLGTTALDVSGISSTSTSSEVAAAIASAMSDKGFVNAAASGTTITFISDEDMTDVKLSDEKPASDTTTTGSDKLSGDWNVNTIKPVGNSDTTANRLASTVIQINKEMAQDGNSITIGYQDYQFSTNEADDGVAGKVYIGDLDESSDSYLQDVGTRLADAAKDNGVWTVGKADANGKITLMECTDENGESTGNAAAKAANKDGLDLTTVDGIKASLGYKTASKVGKSGLVLQIGDTADSYNKMTVKVNDMHADAMGIGDIDISTQEGASEAMKAIKNAVNYVSDTRGDLGAIQNRLDHTINNLSVMQENITDAESNIRDVDVAKEMMEYTKNNILVQSAQAMLAQANQLPQGVLQLLG